VARYNHTIIFLFISTPTFLLACAFLHGIYLFFHRVD